MHASIEQLLSLRDDNAVDADVKTHVDGCAGCQAELDRLIVRRRDLRELPAIKPPVGAWERIEAHLDETLDAEPARVSTKRRWLAAGTAAGLILGALIGLLVWSSGEQAVETAATVVKAKPGITNLAERSRQLEHLLRALGDQPRVVRVSTADTIATLEDHLALVDYQLSYANAGLLPQNQSEALWRERVDLMNSLVQVRYAEAQRVSY